jgi:hypothetical protein
VANILVIERWAENNAWASSGSWSLKVFGSRAALCTRHKGTELKRITRSILKRELFEIYLSKPEEAGPLIHTLESMGAQVCIQQRPNSPFDTDAKVRRST